MPSARLRVLGVPIEIRASFLALAVFLGLPTHPTLPLLAAWIAIVFIAVLVHEAGHAIAFSAFGEHPSIVLHGGGGMTFAPHPGIRRLIVTYAAGPIAGLLLGLVVLLAARVLPRDATTVRLVGDALFVTVGLSLLNLIPLHGLDGRAILDDVVTTLLGRPAEAISRVIGGFAIVSIVGGAILLGAYDTAFIVAFIAIVTASQAGGIVGLLLGTKQQEPPERLIMLGRSDEALALADARLQRAPTDTDALLIRALALRIATRFWEAEGAYTELVRLAPHKAHVLSGRAAARASSGDEAGARADLAALAAMPGEPDHLGRALALYALRDFEPALAVLDEGIATPGLARHQRVQFLHARPLINEALGRSDDALREVDEVLRDRPDDFAMHELRALILIDLGRAEDAMTSAKRALSGAPRHAELLETLGVAERFAGRPDAALPRLVAAATARPELPRARAELAACFAQLGRLGEAERGLESLPQWSERDPFVIYARACLADAHGDAPEVERRLADVARIRPGLSRRAAVDPIFRPPASAFTH